MGTTYRRVLNTIIQAKKKVAKTTKGTEISLNKYSVMLHKLGEHFGHNTIPELLEFVTSYKAKKETLKATPEKPTGKYRLVKQPKK